jgi:hypothetical protein
MTGYIRQATEVFIEITFLSQFCLFNTLFHVYPTTARMKNFAGLVKRHLARFFAVIAPWVSLRDVFHIGLATGPRSAVLAFGCASQSESKPMI